MAGETASSLVPLAGIKTVVTNCSGKSLILHYHVLTLQNKRQKKTLSLNSVLEEAVKLLILKLLLLNFGP